MTELLKFADVVWCNAQQLYIIYDCEMIELTDCYDYLEAVLWCSNNGYTIQD